MIILLSLILGFLYLLYLRKYDIYDPEPLKNILVVAIIGGVISVVLSLLGYQFLKEMGISVQHNAFSSYFYIGPIEEGAKLLTFILLYRTYFKKLLDEPVDAIVYLCAIALGFSCIENVMYAAKGDTFLLLTRFVFATPAHMLFAIPMAYPLYRFYQSGKGRWRILNGFIFASLLHGTWDALAFNDIGTIIFLLFLNLMLLSAKKKITQSLISSKYYPDIDNFFRNGNVLKSELRECLNCGAHSNRPLIQNRQITYSTCENCHQVLVDRDNAFKAIRFFSATFENLNKSYVPSTQEGLYTIWNCAFIDDEKKNGYLDIRMLKNLCSEKRGEAQVSH